MININPKTAGLKIDAASWEETEKRGPPHRSGSAHSRAFAENTDIIPSVNALDFGLWT
jgi:hypothetical protein